MRPGAEPLTVSSIGEVLDRPLRIDGGREALVAADRRLSYDELDAEVDRAAGALHQVGVRRSDVVAVSLPNLSEVVVSFHAAMRLGAVWLGVNRSLAAPEKRFIVEDSGATVLIADEPVDAVPVVIAGGPGRVWAELVEAGGSYPRPVVGLDDPAGIAYTSGTPGRPKGVVHSHRNLLIPGAVLVESRGFGPDLRRGDCAALTILNLQVTSTLLTAQAAGTQVVMDRTDAEGIARWVRDERITSWFGVPTMLHDLSASPEVAPADLQSLDDVWTGGTHLPAGIRERFETRFGIPVHATYGLTEVPTVVTIEPRGEQSVAGSSGAVLPHLEVEVVGPDGAAVPAGQAGEITVRAARTGRWAGAWTPMLGYRGHRASTAAPPVRDGVLHTGDIGVLDDEGHLVVRDRRQAIILRGGANIYPAEVEQVLVRIPGVVGAAVVGVPDDRLGQRVAAAIEVAAGSSISIDRLAATCREELARYKVPEQWHIRPLPRNAMGKVVRPEVERWFTQADG
jgi:acyl-CoA synthetase (AMP-forming)/AMP-acid ligase II